LVHNIIIGKLIGFIEYLGETTNLRITYFLENENTPNWKTTRNI